jgi:acyl-CoA reductase-like NAD-dependent aldehyde dehydrogenase
VREEQFGPIVPVVKFTDVADAIRRANDMEAQVISVLEPPM